MIVRMPPSRLPETPPASNAKAGGEIRLHQALAILELTLFAALTMSAATTSGFET
jgi:hypothetical protein